MKEDKKREIQRLLTFTRSELFFISLIFAVLDYPLLAVFIMLFGVLAGTDKVERVKDHEAYKSPALVPASNDFSTCTLENLLQLSKVVSSMNQNQTKMKQEVLDRLIMDVLGFVNYPYLIGALTQEVTKMEMKLGTMATTDERKRMVIEKQKLEDIGETILSTLAFSRLLDQGKYESN